MYKHHPVVTDFELWTKKTLRKNTNIFPYYYQILKEKNLLDEPNSSGLNQNIKFEDLKNAGTKPKTTLKDRFIPQRWPKDWPGMRYWDSHTRMDCFI